MKWANVEICKCDNVADLVVSIVPYCGYCGYFLFAGFMARVRRRKPGKRRPNKLEENLSGQNVDCCSQALWGSQELRGRYIIFAP